MTRVNLDDDAVAVFVRVLSSNQAGALSILGVDPGTLSTGWAKHDGCRWIYGQKPAEKALHAIVKDAAGVDLIVIESPYSGRMGGASRSNPLALIKLGRAAGLIEGAILSCGINVPIWRPQPSTWRAVLGLNRRSSSPGAFDARDIIADAVHAWASATVDAPLLGPGGGKQVDLAMAIGMVAAARSIALDLSRYGDAVLAKDGMGGRSTKRKAKKRAMP